MGPQYKTDQLRAAVVEAEMEGSESTFTLTRPSWITPPYRIPDYCNGMGNQKARGLLSSVCQQLVFFQIVCPC